MKQENVFVWIMLSVIPGCQELCKDEIQRAPQLLLDFWEALLVASTNESIIQELLFHLVSVYIDGITCRDRSGVKALKTAEDLVSIIRPYSKLKFLQFPWSKPQCFYSLVR